MIIKRQCDVCGQLSHYTFPLWHGREVASLCTNIDCFDWSHPENYCDIIGEFESCIFNETGIHNGYTNKQITILNSILDLNGSDIPYGQYNDKYEKLLKDNFEYISDLINALLYKIGIINDGKYPKERICKNLSLKEMIEVFIKSLEQEGC